MHYIAFLLFWLPQPADAPPATPPRAAFIEHFPTYRDCLEYQSRISNPEIKRQTTCMLMVVEPKVGIKE